MASGIQDSRRPLPTAPWGDLPARLRVLFIAAAQPAGDWLADALSSDSACHITLESVVGVAAGLARLRDSGYDAVLVGHEPDRLDALGILEAVRTGSPDDQAIVVLGRESEEAMAALCYEVGGDAYICLESTTVRAMLWKIGFACERQQLIAENRRLRQAQRHQLQLEHCEAGRLLRQQREMLQDLGQLRAPLGRGKVAASPPAAEDPRLEPLVHHYRELLQTLVIRGPVNLGRELHRLAELFLAIGLGPQQVMQLHLGVLEDMVQGLGSRSARHVLNRADMLILEMMINLAEALRDRCLRCQAKLQQRWLPGCEP